MEVVKSSVRARDTVICVRRVPEATRRGFPLGSRRQRWSPDYLTSKGSGRATMNDAKDAKPIRVTYCKDTSNARRRCGGFNG